MEFTLLRKTIALFGKRESGKTVLARYLIEKERHLFGAIFLFSPTEKVKHDYKGLVKPTCIFDKWSDKWTEKLFEKQASIPEEKMKDILIICDDLGSESDLSTHREFIKIFTRGRHCKISILFLGQYIIQLPKIARSNLDFVLCSQQNAQSIAVMCDEFNNSTMPNADFKNLYKKATTNYGFFIINNTNVKDPDDLNSLYGVVRKGDK